MFITGRVAGDPTGILRAWPERMIRHASYEESRSGAGDSFKLTLHLEGPEEVTVLLEGNDAKGGWEKLRQSK